MEPLKKSIEQVISKAEKHYDLYYHNEEAVKQQLIFEILEALGWNIKNPEEVRPEDKTGMGRADYALVIDSKIVAYLEAKKLAIDVLHDPNPLKQLGKYCYDKGVRYGIVTNGLQWRVMKSFELGKSLEERILFSIDLQNDPLQKSAFLLSLLSKDKIQNLEELSHKFNELVEAFEFLKGNGFTDDEILSALQTSKERALNPSNEETQDGSVPPEDTVEIDRLDSVTYTKPVKAFGRKDSEWMDLHLSRHTWRELLERYAEFILSIKGELPIIPGYITKNKSELKKGRKDGNDRYFTKVGEYYIYVWMSANDILKLLKKLQKMSGERLAITLERKK